MKETQELQNLAINTIRFLSADAVQQAKSGHPGLPMGSAPMAYAVWTRHLRHNPANPRYFTDDSGRAIYLTGSHTWANLIEVKKEGEPNFDYPGFLELLSFHGHNAFRLWTWDHPEWGPWTSEKVVFDPMPFARTGPGLAQDGKPKFGLMQWNDAYFQRLRERAIQAGERGIYVSVMLFEGWCLRSAYAASDPWPSHPYNIQNNINGINGDPDGDGKPSVYTLQIPGVLEYQAATGLTPTECPIKRGTRMLFSLT